MNFAVRDAADGPSRRADARLPATDARSGTRHRVAHRTVRALFWRVATATVWAADRNHTLVVAVNESTDEVKYFLTNATTATRARVLAVAFRRWTVESAFSRHKRRLGSSLGGRSNASREREGRLRVLTHNLMLLAATG